MSFWFANKGKTTRIGRVSARFRNGADDLGGSMPQFYLAKDFKANWDDIFACEGRGYAAGTFQINQNKAVQLVLVANLRENENITNAQIQVILEDFRTIEHQENNL
jgi:hypothetical protein